MDVDSIRLGTDFVKVIREEVAKCDTLLAVIGPGWLDARDEKGNRRLDNPDDFVRIEVGTALKRGITVIPILLQGTPAPKADQLPNDLKELSLRNGLEVRHASFAGDMERLIRDLKWEPRAKWRHFVKRPLPTLVLFLVPVVTVAVLLPRMVIWVPSGEVGVLSQPQGGTVLDPRKLKFEGLNIILPWDKLFTYSLRIQSFEEVINAVSRDGVNMNVTVKTRFRLKFDSVPVLHQLVGADYIKLLGQEITSVVRDVLAEFTTEQIYSAARLKIQEEIRKRAIPMIDVNRDEVTESDSERLGIALRGMVVLHDVEIEASPRTRP
jgi:hypothetical protein